MNAGRTVDYLGRRRRLRRRRVECTRASHNNAGLPYCKLSESPQSFAIYAHRDRPLLKTILTFLIKTCVPPLKLYLSNKGGAISGAVPSPTSPTFPLL